MRWRLWASLGSARRGCSVNSLVQRYTDGLHVAAEQLVGPQIVQTLDTRADQVVPHLTSEP